MFSYKKKYHYNKKGFTLLELMVTIFIAGILASMAVPSFTQAISNNRMTTQVNGLLATLNYARSEAIKRSSNITLCKSTNKTSCGGNWKDGWIVFVDTNNDGAVTAGGGEDILRGHEELSGGNIMKYSGTDSYVNYQSNGLAKSAAVFTLCDSRGDGDKKGIIISITGQGRVVQSTDSNLASC